MIVLFSWVLGMAFGGIISVAINGDARLLFLWIAIGLLASGLLKKEHAKK